VKTCITLLTCDRVDLVEQSIKPLLAGAIKCQHHFFVADGSTTPENEEKILTLGFPTAYTQLGIRGGAGAAIVYALTNMLNHEEGYEYVGLVESDCLLEADWFVRTFDLFARGARDGLEVGAVSARTFDDRVLFQRDGYAVMQNLGAGCVLFTRAAARLVLDTFRTGWSTDNRRIFAQLAGFDIAPFWAFRAHEHALTADWHWDAALAANGLASLALVPSPAQMIGQNPPLEEQGLHIVKEPMPAPRDKFFPHYVEQLVAVRSGRLKIGVDTQFWFEPNAGTWTYFPHQMAMLGGRYEGDWRLTERRGWGTFGWEAGETRASDWPLAELVVPVFGSVAVLVSGGKSGGKVEITDAASGFKAAPELPSEGDNGQVLSLQVPGGMSLRTIKLTALTPGVVFYGIQSRDKQMFYPHVGFDHSMLPGV
jgi:hypothetical protein